MPDKSVLSFMALSFSDDFDTINSKKGIFQKIWSIKDWQKLFFLCLAETPRVQLKESKLKLSSYIFYDGGLLWKPQIKSYTLKTLQMTSRECLQVKKSSEWRHKTFFLCESSFNIQDWYNYLFSIEMYQYMIELETFYKTKVHRINTRIKGKPLYVHDVWPS